MEDDFTQYAFMKRMLELVQENLTFGDDEEIWKFNHELSSDGLERIVTVHPTEEGFIVFSLFNTDEWDMLHNICEISEKTIDEVVVELAQEGESSTIVIDPRQF